MMVALAVVTVVSWALIAVRRGKARMTYDEVINAALVGIPSGIIGARLFHVLDSLHLYIDDPIRIITHFGEGLAIYGAVLGAALGIWIYSRVTKKSFGYLADIIAPAIILAQAIGRVGCTLRGCCYGIETDIFCSVTYVHGSQIIGPVHPTQIYEIIYNLIIFGVLLLLRNRLKPDGSLFLVYLLAYSIWRIGIDFIRDSEAVLFGLHAAQVLGIVIAAITLGMLIWKTRWVKKGEEIGFVPEYPANIIEDTTEQSGEETESR
jgi:phosphatidylglycerol:prolipoprotein diacylglycerol transferase